MASLPTILTYERKIVKAAWRQTWEDIGLTIKKLIHNVAAVLLTVILLFVVFGVGPILLNKAVVFMWSAIAAVVTFLLFFLWNAFSVSPTIESGLQSQIESLQKIILDRERRRATFETLKELYAEGETFSIHAGTGESDEWATLVSTWRDTVCEALPIEKYGFFSMCTPEVFAALVPEAKVIQYRKQLNKLRLIMMRIEDEIDAIEKNPQSANSAISSKVQT